MPGTDFFAPVPYAAAWAGVAVLLVVAVLGWYVALAVLARRAARSARTSRDAVPAPATALVPAARLPLATVKAQYLDLLDGAAQDHRAGLLGDRALALRVSELVRAFAAEATPPGTADARAMALADLQAASDPALAGPVAAVVAAGYPQAFAPRGGRSPADPVDEARRVVSAWT